MYDDAKECTFKPTLHARAGGKGKRGGEEKKDDDEAKRDKDDAAKDRDAFGFLDRQVTSPLAISLVFLLLIFPSLSVNGLVSGRRQWSARSSASSRRPWAARPTTCSRNAA